jgi:hypothetical protein
LLLIESSMPVLIELFSNRFDHLSNFFCDLNTGRTVKIRNMISRIDRAIIIVSNVLSVNTLVKNPDGLTTKSNVVIDAIKISIITTNGIYFKNDLINCDASELYCVSKIGESTAAASSMLSSMLLFLVPQFVIVS